MKIKNMYQGIALLVMALTTASCQNELNEESSQPKPSEKVEMTIRATQGTAPKTRTIYDDQLGVEGIDEIVVTWEGGTAPGAPTEMIKVFGYSVNELDYSVDFTSTPKNLSLDGKSISFSGTIDEKDHYLAMYPVTNCRYDDQAILTSFLDQTQDCSSPMAHLKGFDFMVGEPKSGAEDKYDEFTFTHKATMIRFILDLPSEAITKVSLSSTTKQLYSGVFTTIEGGSTITATDDLLPVSSLELAITNHTPSAEPLKAYMMMPPFDASGDVLEVTVNTKSGSIYKGSITAAVSQELKAGLCYTLSPTLAVTPEINIPALEEGKLEEALKDFTPDASQTELALAGKVNNEDIAALAAFLKAENKGGNITTLDLSGLTIPSTGTDDDGDAIITLTGFTGCTAITDLKLPAEATAIGDDAFAGCTALKNVSQDEPATTTRASISTRLKTVGARAFKGTAIDVMFLHKNIIEIGNNAFEDCAALKALVFEGTNVVAKLGVDVVKNTNEGLQILLPNISDATKAGTYNKALSKPTLYQYTGVYSTASDKDKADPAYYKKTFTDGSGVDDFEFGGSFQ